MARVKAPLFSLDASGTVASSIVFSTWKGLNYVRRHAIPSNPQSATQVSMRSLLRALSKEWAGMSAPDKATWLNYIGGDAISAFNAFIKWNAMHYRQNDGVAKAYPWTGTAATPSAPTTTPTGGVRNISLSIVIGATAPDFWVIHKGATGFAPTWANVAYIIKRVGSPFVWVDSPLAAGNYFYRINGFKWDAPIGTYEAEVTAAAT